MPTPMKIIVSVFLAFLGLAFILFGLGSGVSLLIFVGIAFLLGALFPRRLWQALGALILFIGDHPKVMIAAGIVLYAALIGLVFVAPAIPCNLGALMVASPLFLVVWYRGHRDKPMGGCLVTIGLAVAGGLLIALIAIFRPADFAALWGNLSSGT